MMGHVVDTIRDMGGMMDVHAQFFEASHRNVKLWYRLTNKRQRNNTEAMVSRARLLMMAHACDADALGVPQYETAHSSATSRGEHTVVQQSQRIDVELASSAGCNLLSQQPELRQLSTLLQEACATLHMAMPVFINVVNTAVLAASVSEVQTLSTPMLTLLMLTHYALTLCTLCGLLCYMSCRWTGSQIALWLRQSVQLRASTTAPGLTTWR
ncbi:hypothetical protein V8C86DRAFT_1325463 [Haematococcus lacustris]